MKNLFLLFWEFFKLGLFTFGGGYVIVTLMQKKFVDEYHWINKDEMLDLVAIAQSAPGAIAVNGAIVVGYKIAGILGIIVSVIATILPPFIIISVVSVFYSIFKENLIVHYVLDGMQSGVGAVIGVVVVEMALGIFKEKKISYYLIMFGSFVVNYFFKVNVVLIILTCIVIGIVYSIYERRFQQ